MNSYSMARIMQELEESTLSINFDGADIHAVSEKIRQEIQKESVLWHG